MALDLLTIQQTNTGYKITIHKGKAQNTLSKTKHGLVNIYQQNRIIRMEGASFLDRSLR